jgi:UDP-3-O-[3-hydroxymyristoyl] glucosamine N-acyltransferase
MVDGRFEGDPSIQVTGVAPLSQAGETELGFLAQRRYLRDLPETRARALLVAEALADQAMDVPARVVVKDPHGALPRLLDYFYPAPSISPGIHPTAILGPGVRLGREATVGPYAVLGADVVLGDRVRVGAHSVVGDDCSVGDDSILHPQVVLYRGTKIGARVILHSGTRLGVDGFGYVPAQKGIQKVPQVGACVVEDDVEIGANSCVDRGSIGRTIVGPFTKLDNLVHLAHNVRVGRGVLMAAMTGVAGSVDIGDGVMTGGQAGISGHLSLGAGARVAAQGGVIGDVPAGATVSGYPARDHREYLRAMGSVFRLPETLKRIKELEARVEALETSSKD